MGAELYVAVSLNRFPCESNRNKKNVNNAVILNIKQNCLWKIIVSVFLKFCRRKLKSLKCLDMHSWLWVRLVVERYW